MSGFHGNMVLQRLVDDLISKSGVTAFVETGTHCGETATHMAERHPSLPIFTCEIDPQYYATSMMNLQKFGNVQLSQESSEKFIERLIKEGALGGLPMFFLDAHWYDYWPLLDEVTNIVTLPRFIFLVDDFAVPGQTQFETAPGGGGTIGEHRTKPDARPCGMPLIGPLLPPGCEVVYPTYGKVEAYGTANTPHLVGYTIILKDVPDLTEVKKSPLHTWGGIR